MKKKRKRKKKDYRDLILCTHDKLEARAVNQSSKLLELDSELIESSSSSLSSRVRVLQ